MSNQKKKRAFVTMTRYEKNGKTMWRSEDISLRDIIDQAGSIVKVTAKEIDGADFQLSFEEVPEQYRNNLKDSNARVTDKGDGVFISIYHNSGTNDNGDYSFYSSPSIDLFSLSQNVIKDNKAMLFVGHTKSTSKSAFYLSMVQARERRGKQNQSSRDQQSRGASVV